MERRRESRTTGAHAHSFGVATPVVAMKSAVETARDQELSVPVMLV